MNTKEAFSHKINNLFLELKEQINIKKKETEYLYQGISELNNMLNELTNNNQKYKFIFIENTELIKYETLNNYILKSEFAQYKEVFEIFTNIIKELHNETKVLSLKIILNTQNKINLIPISKTLLNISKKSIEFNKVIFPIKIDSKSWADIAEEDEYIKKDYTYNW